MNGEADKRKVHEQAHRARNNPQIEAKAEGCQRKQDIGWSHDNAQ
jgi:hypothetical protein